MNNEMNLLPSPPLVSRTSSRSRTAGGRSTSASSDKDSSVAQGPQFANNTVRQRRLGGVSNSINDDEKESLSTGSIANDATSSSMSSSYRCNGGSIALGGPEKIVEDETKLAKMTRMVNYHYQQWTIPHHLQSQIDSQFPYDLMFRYHIVQQLSRM